MATTMPAATALEEGAVKSIDLLYYFKNRNNMLKKRKRQEVEAESQLISHIEDTINCLIEQNASAY